MKEKTDSQINYGANPQINRKYKFQSDLLVALHTIHKRSFFFKTFKLLLKFSTFRVNEMRS